MLLFSATAATAALAAVQLKWERHLIFQVGDVNFLIHLKLPFFKVDVATKFRESMRFCKIFNKNNISMMFK